MFRRITKREARRIFMEGGTITVCPCKIRPGGPFAFSMPVHGARYLEECGWRHRMWPTTETLGEFAFRWMLDNWAWYNANYECGYYAHFYLES